MKQALAIILAFVLLSNNGFSQNTMAEEKIDIVFRLLIDQQKQQDSAANKKSSCSLKKPKLRTRKNAPAQKNYECIIYTNNAQALRSKKIVINSELPGFVTAVVTLKQIIQISLMQEVTYIEASKTNMLH